MGVTPARAAQLLAAKYNPPRVRTIRRIGPTSWAIEAVTDRSEPEHRIDFLAGRLYCSCAGFLARRQCQHLETVRREMANETQLATVAAPPPTVAVDVYRHNPKELLIRLQDLKANRELTQEFFATVMVKGIDYGVIPGTDKPALLKPGAESLCELYGFATVIKDSQEISDYESGFLRVVTTIQLVQRKTGEIVCEGVGEANTKESRYAYRWISERDLTSEQRAKKAAFVTRERQSRGGPYKQYRVDNDDLFTLWNTIRKMSKKRAHVDATLTATRSSGLFAQGQEALDDWIDAEYTAAEDQDDGTEQETPNTEAARASAAGRRRSSGSAAPATVPSPKPENPATPAQRKALTAALQAANETWDRDSYRAAIIDLRTKWAHGFPQSGGANYDALTKADASAILSRLAALDPEEESAAEVIEVGGDENAPTTRATEIQQEADALADEIEQATEEAKSRAKGRQAAQEPPGATGAQPPLS